MFGPLLTPDPPTSPRCLLFSGQLVTGARHVVELLMMKMAIRENFAKDSFVEGDEITNDGVNDVVDDDHRRRFCDDKRAFETPHDDLFYNAVSYDDDRLNLDDFENVDDGDDGDGDEGKHRGPIRCLCCACWDPLEDTVSKNR